MRLIKKHAVLLGIAISILFILVAISIYPGGSMADATTIGFDWTSNFFSNLFSARAFNGAQNPSRIWAYAGIILLPCSYAIFFVNMSKKIPEKNAAFILKYGSIANIPFTFLITTPLHDLMLIISTSLLWTCIIVITVYVFKTRLHLFKLLCIVSLLMFYYSVYLWGISDWGLLPLMQKINFVSSTLLILLFEYFTSKEDFAHIKTREGVKLAAQVD